MLSDPIIVVLISVVGGSLLSPLVMLILNKVFSRNKDAAELAETAFNIARQVADDLEESDTRAKQDRLLLREYMRGTRILTGQLEDNRIIPLWKPPLEYVGAGDETPTQPLDNKKPPKRGGFGLRR